MHRMTIADRKQYPTDAVYECRSADSDCVGADMSMFCKKPHDMYELGLLV